MFYFFTNSIFSVVIFTWNERCVCKSVRFTEAHSESPIKIDIDWHWRMNHLNIKTGFYCETLLQWNTNWIFLWNSWQYCEWLRFDSGEVYARFTWMAFVWNDRQSRFDVTHFYSFRTNILRTLIFSEFVPVAVPDIHIEFEHFGFFDLFFEF